MFNYIFLYLSFISILCLRTASWRKTISAEDELILVRSCFINSEIGFCPISFSQGWILVLEFVGGGWGGVWGCSGSRPLPHRIYATCTSGSALVGADATAPAHSSCRGGGVCGCRCHTCLMLASMEKRSVETFFCRLAPGIHRCGGTL